MARAATQPVGRLAESLALEHLAARGLHLVTRNFRCRAGEIDLVMRDGEALVFVEVRYRRTSRFVTPPETVDSFKQRKLLRAAAFFLARHRQCRDLTMRFDVVSLVGPLPDGIALQWLRDAFRPEGD